MNTELKVGSKTLKLANNALTPILYRQIFGKDFLLLFSSVMTKNKSLINKAVELQKVKAEFDAGKIEKEAYLKKITSLGFTDEELGYVNERSELMSELAFIMNKQAELANIEELLKLSKLDYYKFLSGFDPNELKSAEVVGALITFWQGNAAPSGDIEAKNA